MSSATVRKSQDSAQQAIEFAFAIPLMPRSAADDWQRVQHNLRMTVGSALRAAKGQPAAIYIACHDEPDLHETWPDNVHVRRVPFPAPTDPSMGMRDRARKRNFIGAWLREAVEDHVFVMFLDADDLVDSRIVSHVLTHPAGSYVIEEGYLLDIEQGLLLRRRKAFDQTCGSSFICQFSRSELPTSWDDASAPFSLFGHGPQQGHTQYPRIAAELGKLPVTIPFPAGVYVVNHGDNHWTTASGQKRKWTRPSDIVLPGSARRILKRSFNGHDFAQHIAGPSYVAAQLAKVLTLMAKGRIGKILRRR